MSTLVKLPHESGNPSFINPDDVLHILPSDLEKDLTFVYRCEGGCFRVKASSDVVHKALFPEDVQAQEVSWFAAFRIGAWLARLAFILLALFIINITSRPVLAQEDAYHAKSISWLISRDVCDAKMPRHVETTGVVAYIHKEKDGDIHVRICDDDVTAPDGQVCIIVEIIPQIPLPRPRKGQRVTVKGIAGHDYKHGWWELNPVTSITSIEEIK